MPESKLSIRVDEDIKKEAMKVFDGLGLTLSAGINLYLHSVVINQGIPFQIQISRNDIVGKDIVKYENDFAEVIKKKTLSAKAKGLPIALYDSELKKPYFEYPDGRRDYDFNKE